MTWKLNERSAKSFKITSCKLTRPFELSHNDLNMKLNMCIASELYLKQLIVGGMDCVFEISKQFRNESIDLSDNPEFTTCELYKAYTNNNEFIKMTEDSLSQLVLTVNGFKVPKYYHSRHNL